MPAQDSTPDPNFPNPNEKGRDGDHRIPPEEEQPTMSRVATGYVTQFLSNTLSQRGPDALPYAEDTKWLIRQHLVSLVESFPSLVPKSAHFTHNDGRTVNLLQAEGTIPIVFGGVVYNIPATIWLIESYPRQPPSVFLTPTRDMVVKQGHPHVDRSGHVSVPYLRSWVYPSSNLVDLVRSLSHLFGQDPPLYSRQQPAASPTPTPNRNPSPSPNTSQSVSRQSMPSGSVSSASVYPPYGGRIPPSPQHYRPTEDPAEVFRRNAINKIVERVHGDMLDLRKKDEVEMEGLFGFQAELKQREEALTYRVREMQQEMEGLEQQLQLVLMNSDILEGWVRENELKFNGWKSGTIATDVDDIFEICDGHSKQLLEYSSADLGIEDTIYALDRALQDGAIPFDRYLKSIRALSREQFFARATSAKVKAAQVQMQLSNMASRVRVPSYLV